MKIEKVAAFRQNHVRLHHQHSLYDTYTQMKSRCYNFKHKSYGRYGAKGTRICERWLDSETWCGFCAFVDDMGEKPSRYHSIDRKNSKGNYEPSNCKWSTPKQQVLNRGKMKSNKSGYTGVWKPVNGHKWRASITIDHKLIVIGYFDTIDEAIEARKRGEEKYFKPFL